MGAARAVLRRSRVTSACASFPVSFPVAFPFFAPVRSRVSEPVSEPVPSPRDSFAARTLFSRAAIRSSTLPPGSSAGADGTFSPEAFASMSASTASR